jgi:HPt (histidine-containing phosphotransfer) domain-containing protein
VSFGSRPVLRRSALGLGVSGLVALSACDGPGDPAAPGPSHAADPDVALVARVRAEIAAAHRLASAAGSADLVALHRAHLEALDAEVPDARPVRDVPADAVRRREQRLQQQLADAALAAASGALARLLASMSAAVRQQLVVLSGAQP